MNAAAVFLRHFCCCSIPEQVAMLPSAWPKIFSAFCNRSGWMPSKRSCTSPAYSLALRRLRPNYDEEYVALRVKRGIHLRGIAPDDATGRKVHGEDRERLREIRLVPAADFDFTNEINIYDGKVAICSFGSAKKASNDPS